MYVHDKESRLVGLFTVPVRAGHTDFRLPATFPAGAYYLRAVVDGQPQRFVRRVE